MGLFRHRDDRQEGTTYRLRQKLLSIGDDYWVETESGERVIKVNGKAMRIRDTLVLEDPHGRELLRIQGKLIHFRDTMRIERGDETVATVKKALVGIRDRFFVAVEGGDDLRIKGNIVDHEYKFERDGKKVAEVSKRWLRARDTYGIWVAPGEDEALIIASAVCLERMAHD
jgi:uncharacterized protein YxjI